jgi:hypothetical protein
MSVFCQNRDGFDDTAHSVRTAHEFFSAKTEVVFTTPYFSTVFLNASQHSFFGDLRPGRELTANIINELWHRLNQAFYDVGQLI